MKERERERERARDQKWWEYSDETETNIEVALIVMAIGGVLMWYTSMMWTMSCLLFGMFGAWANHRTGNYAANAQFFSCPAVSFSHIIRVIIRQWETTKQFEIINSRSLPSQTIIHFIHHQYANTIRPLTICIDLRSFPLFLSINIRPLATNINLAHCLLCSCFLWH